MAYKRRSFRQMVQDPELHREILDLYDRLTTGVQTMEVNPSAKWGAAPEVYEEKSDAGQ